MLCAKLRLQEKSTNKHKSLRISNDRPRRICQKRMVNPDHEENTRWIEALHFHCDSEKEENDGHNNSVTDNTHLLQDDDIFLSVQNIKFQGKVQPTRKHRACFKYKFVTANERKHRMFVKEVMDDQENVNEDRESQLTCYFDDYLTYINNDVTRPSSASSNNNILCENGKVGTKQIKYSTECSQNSKIIRPKVNKLSNISKNKNKELKFHVQDMQHDNENTKISFHNKGQVKSLTISRTQSPEIVQVIRVDVVCNQSNPSKMSDYEDDKTNMNVKKDKNMEKKVENINFKNNHFADRFLLTKTIKALDEKVSSGAKVTLLCKTFRLSERSKNYSDRKAYDNAKEQTKLKSKQ